MADTRPPPKTMHIPTELTDEIIDLALDNSPTAHADARNLSLSHHQFRMRAQAVLIADINISHRSHRRNPIWFFTHSPHLIPYVRTIRILGDKDQWEDQFPAIITMLTTGEGRATKIVLENVSIRQLIEVEANWEAFVDATISDCLFTFSHCFQWLKELSNLQTLTFPREHPSICCQDPSTSIPTPIPRLINFTYHPDANPINIMGDDRFSVCASGLCHSLSHLQITANKSNIKGVNTVLLICQTTLESLELRIMGCNILTSINVDIAIVQSSTRPSDWEDFFDVIRDRHSFPTLETCSIHLRCSCNAYTYLYTHLSTTERIIQNLINSTSHAGAPRMFGNVSFNVGGKEVKHTAIHLFSVRDGMMELKKEERTGHAFRLPSSTTITNGPQLYPGAMSSNKASTRTRKNPRPHNSTSSGILVMEHGAFIPPKSKKQRQKARACSRCKDVIVISSDEDEQPVDKKPGPPSELEGVLKKLREETSAAKDAQEKAEHTLEHYEEELDELREEALQETGNAYEAQEQAEQKLAECEKELKEMREGGSQRKVTRKDASEIENDATCTQYIAKQSICIHSWFTTIRNEHWQEDYGFHYRGPAYNCPTCRKPVTTQPVEVYKLKSIVEKVAATQGERNEGGSQSGDPWSTFFPPR
ncbi:hypothetical protein ARMSODRAFT_977480 [Armillaria solidipes]|uniref:Uncharacterized protein n=1 Tax=Armillaria solidipes TaxID=1076256 RepID=A0A2H3B6S8_9AGAR|nr:hypothetical protein ARMSODRAFT_977480 [Armillaria solidipes]